jgi:DNA-binding NarL/FixJ family response regulator
MEEVNKAKKYRVVLIGDDILLGEGLQNLLGRQNDVHLVGSWKLLPETIDLIPQVAPDVVLIAEGQSGDKAAAVLTTDIIERFPELPVIRIGLSQDVVRVYTMRVSPARSADLIGVIHNLPLANWETLEE